VAPDDDHDQIADADAVFVVAGHFIAAAWLPHFQGGGNAVALLGNHVRIDLADLEIEVFRVLGILRHEAFVQVVAHADAGNHGAAAQEKHDQPKTQMPYPMRSPFVLHPVLECWQCLAWLCERRARPSGARSARRAPSDGGAVLFDQAAGA
jgi:hypothetical protein